ncbi:MAG: hypothetical protein JWR61_573 [Ferruginibacter sp.]|uniref:beta strand repeat-containing protein n=1 Tax=Ferruginibacter sp. TaxID=1940288 RepID=UPI00265A45BD|nr:hypothetical protein [Ferruginibacter sp.]MDB5275618.1 hypothetical protein [Ferruginibacter sp.]
MKQFLTSVIFVFAFATLSHTAGAQNMAINTDGSTPDASAMVDIASTTKGFLLPRMTTTQQNAIPSPATGLLIFNTTDNVFKVNTGTPEAPVWTPLSYSGNAITSINGLTGTNQTFATGTSGSDFGISSSGNIHTFNIPTASATNRGALSAADWSIFNGKQAALGFTPYNATNPSGYISSSSLSAATDAAISSPANGQILQYNIVTGKWVNTTPGFLSSYTETDPIVRAISGIVKSNGTTISAAVAGTDYVTPSGNITGSAGSFTGSLAGEVTGTQSATVVGNAAVIGKVLTGYTSGSGTVAATDNILQAIQKLNGNNALKAPLASPSLTGTPLAPTATAGTNTTQIATTAFVTTAVSSGTAANFTGSLAGDVTGTQSATVVGKINGTALAGLATGILKNTTTTGIPSIAVAADFPTLNQNTTGNAATVTTNANLTGEVTSIGNAATVTNAAVIAKVLTGYTSGAGTVAATDNILQAIQKLSGNDALKAPLVSPSLTGTPLAPTATAGTNTTQIATTAFVTAAVSGGTTTNFTGNLAGDVTGTQSATVVGKINGTALSGLATGILKNTTTTGVPSIAVAADFPTLNQNTTGTAAGLSANIAESQVTNLTTDLAAKAPVASPTLTGIPAAPTATAGTNTTQIATTAFVTAAVNSGTATAWSLTGNAVTAGSQFLGSTNNVSLRMRTNNVERMVVDSTGKVGVGTASPAQILHVAGESDNAGVGPLLIKSLAGQGAVGTSLTIDNTAASGGYKYSIISTGSSAGGGAGQLGIYGGAGPGYVFRLNTNGQSIAGLNSYTYLGQLTAYPYAATIPGIVVQGFTSQSANLQEWRNSSSTVLAEISANGKLGINQTTPTSLLHLGAGTATANTAPLKFTTGTNLTTPEDGAVEYNGTHFYGTIGSTRYQLDQQGGGTVTSVAALSLGTTGTDISSSVATGTTTPVITLNIPTASAANRGALSAADWTAFNAKQGALTLTTTGSSGAATLVGNTLNIPSYTLAGSAWSLTGNAATAGSNFLGTTNNVSLRMRSANAERMVIDSVGNVGLGVTNPGARFVLKDSMEIRRVGSVAQLLFTNTAGSGDFRIGGDGNDIYWQGGGGRSLQMGSYWATIIGGDRQLGTLPAFVNGISGTSVIAQSYRDASVPLAVQGNSATQSANLMEWRNSSGAVLDFIDKNGNASLGGTTLNTTNPEQLLVDAGTTTSVNAIVGKGSINSYLQLNIQNNSSGTAASSDVVATANNGDETTNYVDMGINGSGNTSNIMGGADDGYLYTMGNNFLIGTGNVSKSLIFMTGGTSQSTNERMRIDGSGNVGIGNTSPNSTLSVTGSQSVSYRSGTGAYTILNTDYVIINTGGSTPTWTLPAASSYAGRVYRLINHGTTSVTLSQAVTTANGTTSTTLANTAGSNTYEIISDGSVWRKIN